MSADPYETVLVPIANVEDAERTGDAIATAFEEATVVAVYVVEKAGGAPDAAGVEQRTVFAGELFDAFEARLEDTTVTVRTRLAYGTDVPGTIIEVANEIGAGAITFVPREGGRWQQLLSGDVARKLINRTDRPVLILPGESDD